MEASFAKAPRECREALECGGLTPLFLPRECAWSFGKMSQAEPRFTILRSWALHPPKVKAGSSPRTPKPSGTHTPNVFSNHSVQ